jgi:hypothetical protein
MKKITKKLIFDLIMALLWFALRNPNNVSVWENLIKNIQSLVVRPSPYGIWPS